MTNVAIITARAHSKGLPGKNLATVGGQSLVSRAINAALESNYVDRVIVSTDGPDIAAEARKLAAEIVWRPPYLATDDAKSIDAVCHALQSIGVAEGICVLLQPTSPLRTASDVAEAIKQYCKNRVGSVISVCESEHHPFKSLINKNGRMEPLIDEQTFESPRQLLPKAVRLNGAIYVNKIEDLLAKRTFFCEPLFYYEMPRTRSIDIDESIDLMVARHLIGDFNE
ncbi:acylneuraminate cytidylyltransferase family protein [Cupriavidus gilardii]|uniref:acylneuraminate cytidylyltransferase family protein n=1 Tax=Cupriavidus gilardii TaxID=82541 RepID=UPI0021B4352C|nr:acylneuraminate cytidylyltransferase family protein [Cupriavidus gilardii]UXC36800.1 acylneuraminate cytidylyltransferase family protein [Cupriavidus gilardii]